LNELAEHLIDLRYRYWLWNHLQGATIVMHVGTKHNQYVGATFDKHSTGWDWAWFISGVLAPGQWLYDHRLCTGYRFSLRPDGTFTVEALRDIERIAGRPPMLIWVFRLVCP